MHRFLRNLMGLSAEWKYRLSCPPIGSPLVFALCSLRGRQGPSITERSVSKRISKRQSSCITLYIKMLACNRWTDQQMGREMFSDRQKYIQTSCQLSRESLAASALYRNPTRIEKTAVAHRTKLPCSWKSELGIYSANFTIKRCPIH